MAPFETNTGCPVRLDEKIRSIRTVLMFGRSYALWSGVRYLEGVYGPEACTRPAHCRTAKAGQTTHTQATIEDRGYCHRRDSDSFPRVVVRSAFTIEEPQQFPHRTRDRTLDAVARPCGRGDRMIGRRCRLCL